jgi:hypothetical protein
VRIAADFDRSGFQVGSEWLFHEANPWIDVSYYLRDGWTDDPQTVEFRFPFAVDKPAYWYDTPGAIVAAGPKQAGGVIFLGQSRTERERASPPPATGGERRWCLRPIRSCGGSVARMRA